MYNWLFISYLFRRIYLQIFVIGEMMFRSDQLGPNCIKYWLVNWLSVASRVILYTIGCRALILFVLVCFTLGLRYCSYFIILSEDPIYPNVRKGSVKPMGRTIDPPQFSREVFPSWNSGPCKNENGIHTEVISGQGLFNHSGTEGYFFPRLNSLLASFAVR